MFLNFLMTSLSYLMTCTLDFSTISSTITCVSSFNSDFYVMVLILFFFFFFQAEDGIRDWSVTGVQTCALPICPSAPRLCTSIHQRAKLMYRGAQSWCRRTAASSASVSLGDNCPRVPTHQIGRASCRERV